MVHLSGGSPGSGWELSTHSALLLLPQQLPLLLLLRLRLLLLLLELLELLPLLKLLPLLPLLLLLLLEWRRRWLLLRRCWRLRTLLLPWGRLRRRWRVSRLRLRRGVLLMPLHFLLGFEAASVVPAAPSREIKCVAPQEQW